jgi:predicted RNase H-like HicB family nuclease
MFSSSTIIGQPGQVPVRPHGSAAPREPAEPPRQSLLWKGEWWIGWVEEVPGVNSQGHTRDELLDNLHDALEEALEMNRAEARAAARVALSRK